MTQWAWPIHRGRALRNRSRGREFIDRRTLPASKFRRGGLLFRGRGEASRERCRGGTHARSAGAARGMWPVALYTMTSAEATSVSRLLAEVARRPAHLRPYVFGLAHCVGAPDGQPIGRGGPVIVVFARIPRAFRAKWFVSLAGHRLCSQLDRNRGPRPRASRGCRNGASQ